MREGINIMSDTPTRIVAEIQNRIFKLLHPEADR